MGDHSVDRLIYDLNGLNEESEQQIDELQHVIMEEQKIYEIRNEDRHNDGEDNDLRRTGRENTETVMELLPPIMEGKAYNSVSKKATISHYQKYVC